MSKQVQLDKYNNFFDRNDYEVLYATHINELVLNTKKVFVDYENMYLTDYPYNYEFIKLSQFHLNEIFNSCIYKTLMNKRDTQTFTQEFLYMNYAEIPELTYKGIWDLVRIKLNEIVRNTKNLKYMYKLSSLNMKYEENNYTSRSNKRFDKLRYLFKYTSRTYNESFMITLGDILEKRMLIPFYHLKRLLYCLFLNSTKSDTLDEETKRRFYNELNKFWLNLVNVAYDDAILYFIFHRKLRKSALKLKKKNLYNILFHRKC